MAAYCRASSADKSTELQVLETSASVARRGWELVETYSDVVSGRKARRPGLDKLMSDARRWKFDALAV